MTFSYMLRKFHCIGYYAPEASISPMNSNYLLQQQNRGSAGNSATAILG